MRDSGGRGIKLTHEVFFNALVEAVRNETHMEVGPLTAFHGLQVIREAKVLLEEVYTNIPNCLLKDPQAVSELLRKLEKIK